MKQLRGKKVAKIRAAIGEYVLERMENRQTVLAKYSLVRDRVTVGDRKILLSESKAEQRNKLHILNLLALPLLIFMAGLAAVTMF